MRKILPLEIKKYPDRILRQKYFLVESVRKGA